MPAAAQPTCGLWWFACTTPLAADEFAAGARWQRDPHGRPRAAAVSYVQALCAHGRRRVSWPGCVPRDEVSPCFHCTYARRAFPAGAPRLNYPHGRVREAQGDDRLLLSARRSIRAGVSSVVRWLTARLHAVTGPGNAAGCSRQGSRRPTGRDRHEEAPGAVLRHAWPRAHVVTGWCV